MSRAIWLHRAAMLTALLGLTSLLALALPARYYNRSYTGNSASAPSTAPVAQRDTLGAGLDSGGADGMFLGSVTGFRVNFCSDGGNLQAAGTLRVYLYDPDSTTWMRNPGLDQSITVTGSPCQAFPDFTTYVRYGGVAIIPNGVTFSAGTTGTVRMTGWTTVAPGIIGQ